MRSAAISIICKMYIAIGKSAKIKLFELICSLRYREYSFHSRSSPHHPIPLKDGCQPPSHWSREDRCSWLPCKTSMERGCASKLQVGGRSNDDGEMSSTPWFKKWIEQDIKTQCIQRHNGAWIEPLWCKLNTSEAKNEFVDLQSEISFGEPRSKRHFSLSYLWAYPELFLEWNTLFSQNVDLRSELFCAFCNLNPDLKPYFLASCAND